jgi:hypothetical protein
LFTAAVLGAGWFSTTIANLDTEIPSPLDDSALTIAEILDERYFRTGAFVSHPFFQSDLGLRQGFQQVHNRRGWWRDVARFWEWADRIKPPGRFFGYLHFMEAHHRHTRSNTELNDFLGTVAPARLDYLARLHPDNCAKRDSRRCRQNLVYDASVLELRTAVATVLNDLQSRGLLEQTLVVVYSDHGEEFWDHVKIQREQGRDPRDHTGLGHGQSLYQELLPPFTRRWFGAGDDRVVYASGIAYGPEQVATRRGGSKFIFSLNDDVFEFYDLAADPLEQSPLSDAGLQFEIDTLTGDYLELMPIADLTQGALGEEQLEDLKAIGYLQGVEEESSDQPDSGDSEESENSEGSGEQNP